METHDQSCDIICNRCALTEARKLNLSSSMAGKGNSVVEVISTIARESVDPRSRLRSDPGSTGSKVRAVRTSAFRTGHARYCQELFLHAADPRRPLKKMQEKGEQPDENRSLVHAAFRASFCDLLGHIERLLLLFGRLIADPPGKVAVAPMLPSPQKKLPAYR